MWCSRWTRREPANVRHATLRVIDNGFLGWITPRPRSRPPRRHHMSRFTLSAALLLSGCGEDAGPEVLDHRVAAQQVPAFGMQFRQPEFTIPAGEERMI